MNKVLLLTPDYYHREYVHDVGQKTEDQNFATQCKRVTLVALPFVSLYKPAGLFLSLGTGALRVVSNIANLHAAIANNSPKEISYQTLQTAIAVVSVAGTIIAHPVGMFISTGQDIAIETVAFANHVYEGEYAKAAESGASIINNALYLGMFVTGGLELSIASLGMQILIGLYRSQKEFQAGNWLEGYGHFAMAGMRWHQMQGQIQMLQYKQSLKKLFSEIKSEPSPHGAQSETCESDACSTPQVASNEIPDILAKYEKNPNNLPPFLAAVQNGDFEATRLFIERGADVNQIYQREFFNTKESALLVALQHPKILKFLIDSGADVNIRLNQKKTPLHFAAGNVVFFEALGILLDNGADVNAVDLYKNTPLHYAYTNKNAFIALLEKGANIHAMDHEGWKPLHRAYGAYGSRELLKVLISRGISLHELDPSGRNALHHACSITTYPGCFEWIKFLIEQHKMNINGDGPWTPLMIAISSQHHLEDDFTILNYLIERGADINAKYLNGQTILASAKGGKLPYYIIDWLIQNGAQENYVKDWIAYQNNVQKNNARRTRTAIAH